MSAYPIPSAGIVVLVAVLRRRARVVLGHDTSSVQVSSRGLFPRLLVSFPVTTAVEPGQGSLYIQQLPGGYRRRAEMRNV